MINENYNVIEHIRKLEIEQFMNAGKFHEAWPRIERFLLPKAGSFSREELINLGDYLSSAFEDETAERTQSGVSAAGVVWESLIDWYLNLCLYGTNAVCIKTKKYIPTCVTDSLSVNHSTSITLSEPDLLLISLPSTVDTTISANESNDPAELFAGLCLDNFSKLCVINIQCKTNWNDNAQIPMLWNLLYSQAKQSSLTMERFSIGTSAHSLDQLTEFGYAFVTVPTNGKSKIKSGSTPVLRANTMTAGNYWGHPTTPGVAASIKEIFSKNFSKSKNFPSIGSVATLASNEQSFLNFRRSR